MSTDLRNCDDAIVAVSWKTVVSEVSMPALYVCAEIINPI